MLLYHTVSESCVERVILLSENLLYQYVFLVKEVKSISVNVQSDLSSEPSSWFG